MSINHVIVNSSPLIVLFKSQQAELLPQLFREIVFPKAVSEVLSLALKTPDCAALVDAGLWLSEHLVNLLKQHAGE